MGQEAAQTAAKSAASMLALPLPAPGDQVTYLLGNKTRTELYDIMAQMKQLVHQNPQQAREILSSNPVLTKTLFQAQIMLGMVAVPTDDGGEGPSPVAHPSAPPSGAPVPGAPPGALPGPPPGGPPGPPPPPPEVSTAMMMPPSLGGPAALANGAVYPGENGGLPGPPPGGPALQRPAFPRATLPPSLQGPGPPQQMGQAPPPPPPPLGPPRPLGAGPPNVAFPGVQQQVPAGATPQYAAPAPQQFPPPFDPRSAQAQAPNPQYLGGPQQQEPYSGPAGPQGNQAPMHGAPQPHLPNHGAPPPVQPGMPSPNPHQPGAAPHNAPPSVNEGGPCSTALCCVCFGPSLRVVSPCLFRMHFTRVCVTHFALFHTVILAPQAFWLGFALRVDVCSLCTV